MKSASALTLLAAACAVALASSSPASAAQPQCVGWSDAFHAGGMDGEVLALLRSTSGTAEILYAGGTFLHASGAPANRVARFDGARWTALGAGFQARVNDLLEFDFGSGPRLVATGPFRFSGTTPCERVAQWDGTSWSAVGSGFPGQGFRGEDLVAFDDGSGHGLELHVVGNFGTAPVQRFRNGAWEPVGTPLDNEALCAVVFDDGSGSKLHVGGRFTSRVVRLDGGSWTELGGLVDAVWDLEVFAPAGGAPALYAADDGLGAGVHRLDAGGWVPIHPSSAFALSTSSFDGAPALWIGTSSGLSRHDGAATVSRGTSWSPLRSLEVADLGQGARLFAGGAFGRIDGVEARSIAATDGFEWFPAPGDALLAPGAVVTALLEWKDGPAARPALVVGGNFDSLAGQPADCLATHDGLGWKPFAALPGPGTSAGFLAMARDPSWSKSQLVVGLRDDPLGGPSAWIMFWDGATWGALGGNLQSGVDGGAHGVVAFPLSGANADLLLAYGHRISHFGQSLGALAKWDGLRWVEACPGRRLDGVVSRAILFDPPGPMGPGVYLCGVGLEVPAEGIAATSFLRWDESGFTTVPSHPLGTAVNVVSMLVRSSVSGTPELLVHADAGLHRFDGTGWLQLSSNWPASVAGLVEFDDGSGPALYNGTHVRLRPSGTEVFTQAATGSVLALATTSVESSLGSSLVYGGAFGQIGELSSLGLARWSDPCAALRSYCTGKLNSAGCVPHIVWSGSASLAANSFVISAVDVLNGKSGLFYYSIWGRNSVPYQGGTLCVRSPFARTPVVQSGGNVGAPDCSGVLSLDFAPWLDGTPNPQLELGSVVNGQWWYRDPASPSTTGLSDAIEFELRP